MRIISGLFGLTVAVIGMGNLFVGAQTYSVPTTTSPSSNRITVVTVPNPHSNYALASGFILIVMGGGLALSALIPDDGIGLPQATVAQETPAAEPITPVDKGDEEFEDDAEDYLASVLN